MTNDCFIDLGIDTQHAIREDFNWPVPRNPKVSEMWYFNQPSFILDDAWTSRLLVPISSIMIFYKPAGWTTDGAHVDVVKQDLNGAVVGALNWTRGGISPMIWYYDKPYLRKIQIQSGGIPTASYPMGALTEMNRYHIGSSLTLVRTNIPHTVEAPDHPRWSISLRLPYGLISDWTQLVSMLSHK